MANLCTVKKIFAAKPKPNLNITVPDLFLRTIQRRNPTTATVVARMRHIRILRTERLVSIRMDGPVQVEQYTRERECAGIRVAT